MAQESVEGWAEPAFETDRGARPMRYYGGWRVTYQGEQRKGRTRETYSSEQEAQFAGRSHGELMLAQYKRQGMPPN